MSICFIDGGWRPAAECALPVTDLAIQRGIGVFDSIRVYSRRAFALDEHMKRLRDSAFAIGIECGDIINRMYGIVRDGAGRADCPGGGDCTARVYITGGDVNDRGRFPNPRHFAIFDEFHPMSREEYERGVALHPTPEGRPYPLVKTINYLVGLVQCAGMDDVLECLYCPGGEVTETLRSSFFIYRKGRLVTAPLGRVLGGVTRNIIVELARSAGIEVDERCPSVGELGDADEAFLTGSSKEVVSVVKIGGTLIGDGRPGPIASRLRNLFRDSMERWLDRA
jgi:branched-chain amino acid aminotransferase